MCRASDYFFNETLVFLSTNILTVVKYLKYFVRCKRFIYIPVLTSSLQHSCYIGNISMLGVRSQRQGKYVLSKIAQLGRKPSTLCSSRVHASWHERQSRPVLCDKYFLRIYWSGHKLLVFGPLFFYLCSH